jgi:peroxiredoxin
VTLAAYQGRPVILNFWATWCNPCRQEMPLLQQAYETHQHMGLTVLGISQDESNRSQVVRTYWWRAGLTFPTLLDPDGTAAKRYQVVILPSTIFVDAQGQVTAIHRGPLNASQLEQYLDKIMAP